MKPKKSRREKLADSKGLPRVSRVGGKLIKRCGDGTFVIPAPLEVDALMKRVPKGRLVTINELRAALAAQGCQPPLVLFAPTIEAGVRYSWKSFYTRSGIVSVAMTASRYPFSTRISAKCGRPVIQRPRASASSTVISMPSSRNRRASGAASRAQSIPATVAG